MAGTRRAVFLSDLHLGSNPRLDDFGWDAQVDALVETLELNPKPGGQVDLVLLGDVFDLWQSVTDEECEQEDCEHVLESDLASELARLDAIHARHPTVFAALGRFARRPGCRLFVVPGNHDHVLIRPEAQARLAASLGVPAGPSLWFTPFYEHPALGLYAEHGSQFHANNAYADWGSIARQDEAAGYFFQKLVINRMELLKASVDNPPPFDSDAIWESLRTLLPWLASVVSPRRLWTVLRLYLRYRSCRHVPRFMALLEGWRKDIAWAERLYTDKPSFRARLSPDETSFVLFGHTHHARHHVLTNGAIYFNTGAWSGASSTLPLVVVEALPGGVPFARLRHFHDGRIT
jgi:UDP-2,3-diacylglucosamine pyrophosphatase LpxH